MFFWYAWFMRTIHRDIVGGFIFSKDGKMLLGKNKKGGVYEGCLVVPGGGVDEGETQTEALRREMLEETGIDTNNAKVTMLNHATGENEKTLRDTGERVFVQMDFYNYRIDLPDDAHNVAVKPEDDWDEPEWFNLADLKDKNLSPPTRQTLVETGLLQA